MKGKYEVGQKVRILGSEKDEVSGTLMASDLGQTGIITTKFNDGNYMVKTDNDKLEDGFVWSEKSLEPVEENIKVGLNYVQDMFMKEAWQ